MLHPDNLPAQCSNPNCRYVFAFANPIGGIVAKNMVFARCSTSCPRCHSSAAIMNIYSDNRGSIIYSGVFSHLRKIKDPVKLDHLRKKLEAANENFSAEELNQALAGVNNKFKNAIPKNISNEALISIVTLILTLIAILLNQINFQKQHNLEKERFEFEQQNKEAEHKYEAQISNLIEQLENNLSEATKKAVPPKKQAPKKIKNCERNKPCPCGSNKKSKDCHIYGRPNSVWT